MPKHNIPVEDSFGESLGLLSIRAQEEIIAIVRALEADPYYLPDQESFIVEVDSTRNDYAVVCRNIDGWDGWWLVWFFKYSASAIVPTIPEYVILMLRHFGDRPLKGLEPFEREAGGDDRATPLGTGAASLAWLTQREPKEQEKDSEPNYSRVRIFYATDRQEQSDPEYGVGYEALRSPGGILRYGEWKSVFPRHPSKGVSRALQSLDWSFARSQQACRTCEDHQPGRRAVFRRGVWSNHQFSGSRDVCVCSRV